MSSGSVFGIERDLRNLAILEVIVGGGLSLGSVIIPLLLLFSDANSKQNLLVATALISGAGWLCVVIGYLSKWRMIGRVKGALLGSIGCACMIVTYALPMQLSSSRLQIGFCAGALILVLAYGLWCMYGWSRIAQSAFCLLLFAFLGFLLVVLWQRTYLWRWDLNWLGAIGVLAFGAILLAAGFLVLTEPHRRAVLRSTGGGIVAVGVAFVAILLWQDHFRWRWPKESLFLIGALFAISPLRVLFLLQHPECKSLFSGQAGSKPNSSTQRSIGNGVSTLVILFLSVMGLAAVWAPSSLRGLQRGKQMQTMSRLFNLAYAVEEYALDHQDSYPTAETIDELATILEPRYLKDVPRVDDWNRPIEYCRITILKTGVQGFVFRSAGRDGKYEHSDPAAYSNEPVENFDRDLVYSTLSGSQWPEGTMPP